MKKYLIALVIVILLIIIAGVVYLNLNKPTVPDQIACTMEAKICPDGVTYVGRQGPNCEFAPCPIAQAVDETADWKTYTSNNYVISYPAYWESPFRGWSGGSWTAGKSIDNNNYCVIDVEENSITNGSNQGEIKNLLGKGYLQTSIKIGGIGGIKLTRNPSEAGLTEAIYVTHEGNNFRIGRNRGVGDKIENECLNVFDQALSTFKFTK